MREGGWFNASFCFFKKAVYEIKASVHHLSFNIRLYSSTLSNKTIEFSFNTLLLFALSASLQNCVTDSTAGAFFAGKTTFCLKMLEINDTKKNKYINISSLKQNFKYLRHIF